MSGGVQYLPSPRIHISSSNSILVCTTSVVLLPEKEKPIDKRLLVYSRKLQKYEIDIHSYFED